MIVYVVAESNGGQAVVDVFDEWEPALAYARSRAENYSECEDATWETNYGIRSFQFGASWAESRPGAATRVDIVVWETKVRT